MEVARVAGSKPDTVRTVWDEIVDADDHDDDLDPLPPQVVAQRRCLGCEKMFQSKGVGHRCPRCRDRDVWRSGIAEYSASYF